MKYWEIKQKHKACNKIRATLNKKPVAYNFFYNYYVYEKKTINEIVNMEVKHWGSRSWSRDGKCKLTKSQIDKIIYQVDILGFNVDEVCKQYWVTRYFYTHYAK